MSNLGQSIYFFKKFFFSKYGNIILNFNLTIDKNQIIKNNMNQVNYKIIGSQIFKSHF